MRTGDVLKGLALNLALPAELLRPLLRHREAGAKAMSLRTDLPRELVEEILASGDDRLARALAVNPALPDGVRRSLATHREPRVRTALTAHAASLPPDVLATLGSDADADVRKFLAQCAEVPSGVRFRLADDPDPRVRQELATSWVTAPEDVRRRLLTDPEPTVRKAACSTYSLRLAHPAPPADLHEALLADPATRTGVVAYLDPLTPEMAAALAADPDMEVREAVAAHPQLPPELRDALARRRGGQEPVLCAEILVREDTPDALRAEIHAYLTAGAARLESEEDVFCQVALLDLQFRTVEWVRADPLPHVDSPYPCFRHSAAAGGPLPAEAVARLLDDEDQYVRLVTVRHHGADLDPSAVERVERAHKDTRKPADRPSDRYTYPPAYLRRFATDPDPRIRELAPRDQDLPAALAEELATDPEARVLRAVADHPRVPVPALLALLSDDDPQTAEAAGRNRSLPVSEMERIIAAKRRE